MGQWYATNWTTVVRFQEGQNVSPRHTSHLLRILHILVLDGYRTEAWSWPLTAVHICSPSGPGAPTYIGFSHVTGIICNMTLVNSAFHTQQDFSENYPQVGHAPSKERPPFPARTEQLSSCRTDFHEIWYLGIFRKCVEKIKVSLKSDKNKGYFTWRPINIF